MAFDLSSTAASLGSSKVKDRNDALNSLELSIDLPHFSSSTTTKQCMHIIECAHALISIEIRILRSGKTSLDAAELRVISACRLIRKITAKKLFTFKPSQGFTVFKVLEACIHDNISNRRIVVEGCKTLVIITSSAYLISSFTDENYCRVVKSVVSFINAKISTLATDDGTDYLLRELFQALNNLVSSFALPSPRLCLFESSNELLTSMKECILNYTETYIPACASFSMTILSVLKIANFIILNSCLESILSVQRMTLCLLKAYANLKRIEPSSKDSLIVFLLLASDYLTAIAKSKKVVGENAKSKVFEFLELLILEIVDLLDSGLSSKSGNSNDLEFGSVDFYDCALNHSQVSHWFKTKHIFLNVKLCQAEAIDEQRQWLVGVVFTKLFNLYFLLKSFEVLERRQKVHIDFGSYHEIDATSETPQLKKRKVSLTMNKRHTPVSLSLADCLKMSTSFSQFFLELFAQGRKVFACQILLFFHSLGFQLFITPQFDEIWGLLISNLDDSRLSHWILLCLKIMLDCSTEWHAEETNSVFSAEILIQLSKLYLQAIKSPEMSSIGCSGFMGVVNYLNKNSDAEKKVHVNSALSQTMFTILDLVEINGPAVLDNHSILFWFQSYVFFENQNNITSILADKVLMWLVAKIDNVGQSFSRNNFLLIDKLVQWLTEGKQLKISANEIYGACGSAYNYSCYDTIFMNDCILWYSTDDLRNSLFLEISNSNEDSHASCKIGALQLGSKSADLIERLITKWVLIIDECAGKLRSSMYLPTISLEVLIALILKLLFTYHSLAAHSLRLLQYRNTLLYKLDLLLSDILLEAAPSSLGKSLNLINSYLSYSSNNMACVKLVLTDREFVRKFKTRINEYLSTPETIHESGTMHSSSYGSLQSQTNSNDNDTVDSNFGDVRKTPHHGKTFSNGKINNTLLFDAYENHTFHLQVFLLFTTLGLFSEADKNLNISEFLNDFSASQILDCVKYLSEDISLSSIETADMTRLIGNKLLSIPGLDRQEVAITSICRLCSILANSSLQHTNQDFIDVLGYIVELSGLKAMKTTFSIIEFQKLMLVIISKIDSYRNSALANMIQYLDIWSKSVLAMSCQSNFVKLTLAKPYSAFYSQISASKVSKVYKLVFETFETPQQSVEKFFTFSYFLTHTSMLTDYTATSCMFNLLEFLENDNAKFHINAGLSFISKEKGFDNPQEMFKRYSMELLSFWLLYGALLLNFPLQIFGFQDLEDFVNENYLIISSLLLAYTKGKDYETDLQTIVNLRPQSTLKSTIFESLTLAIPLAFTKNGIRNDIFDRVGSVLRKECSTAVITWLPQIIWQIIALTDLSASQYLNFYDSSKQTVQSQKHLGEEAFKYASLEAPVIYISPKTSSFLIESLIENYCKAKKFWEVNTVYYIARTILSQLEKAQSNQEVLRNIRMLAMLSKVTPASAFSNFSLLKLFVYGLLPHMLTKSLYHETVDLIWSLLEISKIASNQDSILLVFKIATQLAKLKHSEDADIDDLTTRANYLLLRRGANPKPLEIILVKMALDYVASLKVITVHDINNAIKTCYDLPEFAVALEDFVGAIFENNHQLANFECGIKTDIMVAHFLAQMKKQDITLSENFVVWKARSLGQYYYENGKGFEPPKPRKNLGYLQTLFHKEKVHYIMSLVFHELKRSLRETNGESHGTSMVIEDAIGVLINYYQKDSTPFESVCDFTRLFGDCMGHILSLDFKTYQLLRKPKIYFKCASLEDFFQNLTHYCQLGFDIWCTELLLGVIKELESSYEYFKPFKVVISNLPHLSKKLLTNMIIFYLNASSASRAKMINQIVNGLLSLDSQYYNEDLIMALIDLCLGLRIGAKYEHKRFVKVFEPEFCQKLYTLACKQKLWKISLMFYESFVGDLGLLEPVKFDIQELKDVYNNMDVDDIRYSLPVVPSLGYAMESISHDQNSWKKAMFGSALFEANYNSTSFDSLNSSAVVDSMLSAGLAGISSLVSKYFSGNNVTSSNDDAHLDNVYKWAWKLNQWDLAVAEDHVSYNSVVYKALKYLNDSGGSHESFTPLVSECYRDALKWRSLEVNERTYNDSGKNDLFDLLHILYSIESIANVKDRLTLELFQRYTDTKNRLFERDFKLIENGLEARQAASSLMRKFEMEKNVIMGTESFDFSLLNIVELELYGNLARSNHEDQKSINSMMKINSIISGNKTPNLQDDKSFQFGTLVSQLSIAANLWQQRETSVAVVILKELRAKVDSFNESKLHERVANKCLIDSLLVEWLHESKQETSSLIVTEYVEPYYMRDMMGNKPHLNKMFHTFAQFCDSQIKDSAFDQQIAKFEKIISIKSKDFKETSKLQSNEAKRYAYKLKKQLISDSSQVKKLIATKNKFVEYAVYFYLRSIIESEDYDSDVDRFCALWLKHSDNRGVAEIIQKLLFSSQNMQIPATMKVLPSYKFLPWISQLSSRLSLENSEFQKLLNLILMNVCYDHPYHSLFILKSLILQTQYNSNPDAVMKSRSVAANNLWIKLMTSSKTYDKKYLSPISMFCDESVNLANYEINSSQKHILLDNLVLKSFWLERLPILHVALPTNEIPVRKRGDYANNVATIVSINSTIDISSSGISRPKIAIFQQSDGATSKVLFKGNTDDLRQDAIMEQVFEKVNKLLLKDKETKKRKLKMRTYKVVPLGPQAGMIEFVPNSMPFIEIVYPLHSKHDAVSHSQASKKMHQWESLTVDERISNFRDKLCKEVRPVFREFFFKNFLNPYDWFESRLHYSRGTATCSMVGYILGLGDRHCNNILIDKLTGEPVHIDLGVAFDQGKLLTIPETVPFRLTRDIVDGMGVSGVEGIFRKSCEQVFRVLRERKDQIHGILDILKWDPLYMWTVSPLRKRRLQDQSDEQLVRNVEDEGFEASRAVSTVQAKLIADGLSVEAVVRQLIQEASDVKNLALLFRGWAPFY